jgi:hypothetical protein
MKATFEQLGKIVARCVAERDLLRLEIAALDAGSYQTLMAAARAAGVDTDELEELLAGI